MNFNNLSQFVYRKYGLKFTPVVPGSTELYLLKSPLNGDPFAMMSRIRQNDHFIATLDLRCGSFSTMIRDLPGFSTAFRLKSDDWVGAWLERVSPSAVESAFDYAFKLAMNGEESKAVDQQPYIYVPGNDADDKYQAQAIKPRKEFLKKKKEREVPEQIRKMLESYDYSILPAKGRAKNFYHQAQIMKDYEDDFKESAAFKRFYPTFHDMTVQQLRTYFTWRTALKQKTYLKTSTSYAFVYIYELLNNVFSNDSEQGYQKLRAFEQNYAQKYDPEISAYLESWIKDYVIFHHLTAHREVVFKDELADDKQYHLLLRPENYSPDELLAVIQEKSTYLDHCMSYKKMANQFAKIFYEIWQELKTVKLKTGKTFFNQYIASRQTLSHHLFSGAVFYWRTHHAQNFAVDSERQYFYQDEAWYCTSLHANKRQTSNLNTFLHEVDRIIRIKFKLGRPLKERKLEYEYLGAITRGINNYQQAEIEAKKPKIKINFANLKQIRSDASITRDSLLTDEEKKLEQEEQAREQITQVQKEKSDLPQSEYGLSQDETVFLLALIKKQDWHEYVKSHHLMPSILADAINDKLFDEIGDAVIEFDEHDQPRIIADYQSDLEEMFLERK